MSPESLLWMLVALPCAGAVLSAVLGDSGRNAVAAAAAAAPIAALGLLVAFAPRVLAGESLVARTAWLPSLGLELSLRLDGLSLLFAGIILVIGLLVILYARYYLSEKDPAPRFYAVLLVFMSAMLGIALSDNLLLLVVFWEATSLTSFLLVGFRSHEPAARSGARMALTVTGAGGLALLAGVLLLHEIAGTLEIGRLNAMGDAIRAHPLYGWALTLVLLGAFTKSAQVPFHFWLPNAMAAPTPASAYLHSATMVKAGLFLLARLYPALSGTDAWFYAVGGTGLATLLFASWRAVPNHDLKGLLAYSTISHLGLVMLLLGLGTPLAALAAVFHIVNHATFKASLFMAAGIVDHETGTRDMRRLCGLWRHMPTTGLLATVAAASMAGVPLLNGFLSKEMLFAETLELRHSHWVTWAIPACATLAGAFAVAYSTRFIHDVFFNGEWPAAARVPHEPPRWMRVPMELLVVVCVLVGVAPAFTVGPLLEAAARSLLGADPPPHDLAVWHGFNLPLAMSAVALAGGTLLYFWLQKRRNLHAHVTGPWTGHRIFEALVARVTRLASRVSPGAAGVGLPVQLAVLLAVACAAAAVPFVAGYPPGVIAEYTPMNAIVLAGWCVLVVSAGVCVVRHHQPWVAIVALGAVGLVVAGAFAWFSAPDLALTQIAVEAATVLLLLAVLPHLPAARRIAPSPGRRLRDALIAGVSGAGLAAAAWWMTTRGGSSVSAGHIARSVPDGGGTNVVNVILVDFRGFDTYGEITVLAIAAAGVVALCAGLPRWPRGADRGDGIPGALPAAAAGAFVPLALAVAGYLFLRGHNLPGGGFVAGLVTAVALAFVRVAEGTARARALVPLGGHGWIVAGLAIAGLTGAGAWCFGRPFLTSAHGHLGLGPMGDFHWASAALFDAGVFVLVTGVVLRLLSQLGDLRAAREG